MHKTIDYLTRNAVGLAIMGFIVVGGTWATLRQPGLPAPSAAPAQPTVRRPPSFLATGTEGRTRSSGRAFAAVDDTAWTDMVKAIGVKDELGLQQLVISGRVLLLDPGTKVLALENSVNATKVRILDGKHIGKAGWVIHEDIAL